MRWFFGRTKIQSRVCVRFSVFCQFAASSSSTPAIGPTPARVGTVLAVAERGDAVLASSVGAGSSRV